MQQESDRAKNGMEEVVERNLEALLSREKAQERRKTREELIADKVTSFAGSMPFVYLHMAIFGVWILWNLGALGLKPFDKSFVILAMFASVEAIFLSTFVLISQNRSAKLADKRADLELHVNLLAEHEITRLITMTSAIAKKLDIEDAAPPEIEALSKDVHPEKVMDFIERAKKED
ncbi:MAG TPA: DUF1003 domain-containing protein [Pedobacter sp.]|jgi:uncharacterized membrane protein